jgi:NAD(P)-dependent dehydrogenase (short-subunit alcohol dehydrogenase family)
LKLNGKIALITGSGRGIGRTTAFEFAKEGATVFVNDVNREGADETCNLIKKAGGSCFTTIADVGDYNEVQKMFKYIYSKADRLDILVNNAAILRDKTLHNMEIKFHWDDVLRINLSGVFYCCRTAIEKMRDNNYGRIINMASVIGLCGNFGQNAYAATKAGVIGFTKSLAHEGAAKGITANVVAPGFIDTEMVKDIPPEVKQKIVDRIPMKKYGQPDDIAKLILFLASDDASYITGQVLNANGGFLMP